jgi:cytochrome b
MPLSQDTTSTIKVWDPLIRIFHWSLVLTFFLAYVTEDSWEDVHVIAGYIVAVLIGFRLVWGVIGTRRARFTQFVKSPQAVLVYLKQMIRFKVPHYLGHNPAAAAMIICLLISLIMISLTGMIIIAGEGQGPLAGTVFGSFNNGLMEDIHELFANVTLLLVFLHVAGVLFSSLLEKENLIRAMITGRKRDNRSAEDA